MAAMPDEITLRTPTDAEFARFAAPLSIAFNEEFSEASIENDRQTIELDRFVGALDGDEVVGGAGAYTFRLTVPGGEVGAAGITMVGVLPSHRRRGILRQMMTWLLAQARERHEPVAVLWASEAAIYKRFGYGHGTVQVSIDAAKDKIRFARPAERPGRVRILELDEAVRLFPPIYDAIRTTTPGSLDRSEARWRYEQLADAEWMRHGNGPKRNVVLEVDGEPRGYAIYRTHGDWDQFGPKGWVTVLEVTALDAVAEQSLWEWIFGIDLIGTVRSWRSPFPLPLQLMVTEPRRLGMTMTDGLWLRLIDLPAALAARTYRGPAGLVLEVTDEFCPRNAGRWQLTVPGQGSGATATVTPAPDAAEVDLALDTADLASLYLGCYRPSELARAGRIRECQPGALAVADSLFAVDQAPTCATMF